MAATGSIHLPMFRGNKFQVFGGPYKKVPNTMVGVKMAEEIHMKCEVDIPTVDYSVPDPQVLLTGLEKTVVFILKGSPVYVGCWGGRGRTGILLAVLAKAWGVEKPIEYVREQYSPHAVETKDQEAFVRNFEIPESLKRKIFWAKVRGLLKSNTNLTQVA